MELLLIRHAQTTSNVTRALDTAHPGADLTELGEQQVRELEMALAGEHIDAVHVSPRLRTRRTAVAVAASRGLAPIVDDRLVEVDAGEWEMSNAAEHIDGYHAVLASWLAGDLGARMPAAESGHEALIRFDAAVAEILAWGHDRVAVVSHGAILRVWCGARATNAGDVLTNSHILRNTALVRLTATDGRLTITAWDDQLASSSGESGPLT